jgi:hypothetical protein
MLDYLQFLCGVITGYRENRFPGHDERDWTKGPSVSAQNKSVSDHNNAFDRS